MKIVGENNGGNDDGVGSTATTTTAVITTTGTREQSAYSAHAEFAQAGSEQGVKLIDWTTVRNGDSPCATPIVSRATSNETCEYPALASTTI